MDGFSKGHDDPRPVDVQSSGGTACRTQQAPDWITAGHAQREPMPMQEVHYLERVEAIGDCCGVALVYVNSGNGVIGAELDSFELSQNAGVECFQCTVLPRKL
eukprot:100393-Chlamydomonas_euryale.AAC.1